MYLCSVLALLAAIAKAATEEIVRGVAVGKGSAIPFDTAK